MGASGSVHDVLAEDPVFERVREGGDGDVEGRAGRRDDVLELPIGLPPIRVAFRDERTIFCACEHGAVCLIQLPRLPASSASSPCIFEAASSGPPVVKTPIGNLVSSLGAISGTSVDLLSMVRAFPSLRRLGGRTEMTAWLWDYCQGASALAPDGSRVAYGGNAIYLCALEPPALLAIAENAHGVFTKQLLFTPRGDFIVSGGADGYVRVWDATSLRDVSGKVLKHGDSISQLALDSSGTRLASAGAGSDRAVYVWDMRGLRALAVFPYHTRDVTGLAFIFSCSGLEAERGMLDRLLVSGGMDGKLALWDTRPELAAGAQQQALQGQTEPTAEASPGGVVSPLYEIDLGEPISCLAAVRGGDLQSLVSAGEGTYPARVGVGLKSGGIALFGVKFPGFLEQEGGILHCHEDAVQSLAFSPCGRILLSASTDGALRLVRVPELR